jgi:hypothetical protein
MNPPRRPRTNPLFALPHVALKEIRLMSHKLNRFLDATASITIVFLALYVGVSTFGLGA